MNGSSKAITAVVVIIALGALAYSQLPDGKDHAMEGMTTATAADVPHSTKAYEAAMAVMMNGMMTPLTGKPDLDFVQGMIPHHQGAIDMAKIVLLYGKNPEVRTLAEGVVKAQESEITFMKDWLAKADQAAFPMVAESRKSNEQAASVMMTNMMMAYTGDADVDFIKGMIPHHRGAIDMARVALQFTKDPALRKLAQDIVTAQKNEIAFMSDWLAKYGK